MKWTYCSIFVLSIHILMKFCILFTEIGTQIFSAATAWANVIYVIPRRER
jgi:hypothetical protein